MGSNTRACQFKLSQNIKIENYLPLKNRFRPLYFEVAPFIFHCDEKNANKSAKGVQPHHPLDPPLISGTCYYFQSFILRHFNGHAKMTTCIAIK